jgi:alkaline phosphatase D
MISALLVAGNAGPWLEAAEPLRITHGIASGDVTATEAAVWARANRPAQMVVELTPVQTPAWPLTLRPGPTVGPADDFTGKVVVAGLMPDTGYLYWVRFRAGDEEVVSLAGEFRTLPLETAARPVTLVWWGDLGGQGYCRDPERGYRAFRAMERIGADLAIANGDSIYADSTCPPTTTLPDHPRNAVSADPETAIHQLIDAVDPRWASEPEVLAAYRGKWKYNAEDEAYRRFRARTPHVYQWDDHEVINDWSPAEERIGALRNSTDRRPMSALVGPARKAFFEHTPIRPDPQGRIYRSLSLGRLAELIVLDLRSYRDDNLVPDGKAKTILGAAQKEWLLRTLRQAQARGVLWKIISTTAPLSVPTGSYDAYLPEGPLTPLVSLRDGWAAGRRLNTDTDGNQASPLGNESELREILRALKADRITNVVWLTTDVHHARLLRYEPDHELTGLVFHEFISGPVSAYSAPPAPLSTTFRPIELFARGRSEDPARPSFLNFGMLRISEDGSLRVEIRDVEGAIPSDPLGRPGALTITPTRP